jgi:hypothetical protein
MVKSRIRGVNYLHKLGYRILLGVSRGPWKGPKGGAPLGGDHRNWSEYGLNHELDHWMCPHGVILS